MESKEDIREYMRTRSIEFETSWRDKQSVRIGRYVLGLPETNTASTIAAYLALPSEVQITSLIETLQKAGKRICIPAFDPKKNTYGFARLNVDTRFVSGPSHVREPASPVWVDDQYCDLILIPGVAFDQAGHRLGRGGGVYDRLLKSMRGLRVGIAFSFQVIDGIISEAHDVPMDIVITENGVHRA